MTTPDLAPFDFNGTWRDDMLHQKKIEFIAAKTHDERRNAADLYGRLLEWKERAEKAA